MKLEFFESDILLMKSAYIKYGEAAEVGVAVEECAELIVALQKYINRSKSPESIDNILDEIADVEIMLASMRLMLEIDCETLRQRIDYKLDRLRSRMAVKDCHD